MRTAPLVEDVHIVRRESCRFVQSVRRFFGVLLRQPHDTQPHPSPRVPGIAGSLFLQGCDCFVEMIQPVLGDAKKQASGVADEVSDTAQDLYDHARDSAADLAGTANKAARKTASSFERALRNTVETQPYTAVAIALGLGWLFGRMHRPL